MKATRRLISTGSAMEREIGYSRAVVQDGPGGRWVLISGTTGFDYSTMSMPQDAVAQTRNIFATLTRTLKEADMALHDIIRVRYTVSDAQDIPKIILVLGEFLGDIRPAAAMYVAGMLEERMKVEIEADAFCAIRDH